MYESDDRFEEDIDLRTYLRIVFKRKWTILTFFLVVVILTSIATFRMTPMYMAEARILLDEEKLKVLAFQDVLTTDTTRAQYYSNQQEILTSRTLAKRVINDLKLVNDPEFNPEEGSNVEVRKLFSQLVDKLRPGNGEKVKVSYNDPIERTVDGFIERLDVGFVGYSGVARVSFYAKDPRIAAKVVNRLADHYIEQDMERKYGATKKAVNWLDLKLVGLKKKLRQSEYALQKYKEENDLISLEDKQNIVVQKLAELNTAYTRAKTERIALEAMYNQIGLYNKDRENSNSFGAVPAVVENFLIQKLKQEYVKLRGEYSELSSRYGKQHPKMVRLDAQIETIGEQLQLEIMKVLKSIETKYRATRAQEDALEEALREQKTEALIMNKKAIQYGVLKREVGSNRDLYDVFLTRLKETDLSKEIQSSNIRILERAKIPEYPAKPRKKLNIAIAMVVGLMLGLGVAFLGEYLDTSVKTPEEIEKLLEIPSMGVINVADKSDLEKGELVVLADYKSRITESMLALRTNVIFSFSDDLSRTLLVTSSVPEEGKSFVAMNLAVLIANLDKEIVLVDADMRMPTVHKAFGKDSSPGLSDVLVGEATVEEAVTDTFVPRLKLLPSGTRPPNPLDLIGSEKMVALIEELKKRYDWVVFDTPPLISVADAAVLSGLGAKILFVIKSGEIKKDAIKRIFKQIESVNAKVIGGVLNFVDFKKDRYYYNYYYKYYSYYSDDDYKNGKQKSMKGKARL